MESGVPLPPTKTISELGLELLERKDVKDYLMLMGQGDDGGIQGMIERLGAARRLATRKDDYRGIKEIDMEIAKLKGYTTDHTPPPPAKTDLADMARAVAFLMAGSRLTMQDITPPTIEGDANSH